MKRFLAAGVLLCAGVHSPAAHADGRYQMLEVPDGTGFGGEKIVILDTVGGHLWTWSEHAATPGGPGGRFLIYQGQVRPAGKMGDIIQNEEWRGKRR
jgi:hypothetical protein